MTGVTTALKTIVSPGEKAQRAHAPVTRATAFDRYLRQREILILKGLGGRWPGRQARLKRLEEAVTFDRSFVKAWAELVAVAWPARG